MRKQRMAIKELESKHENMITMADKCGKIVVLDKSMYCDMALRNLSDDSIGNYLLIHLICLKNLWKGWSQRESAWAFLQKHMENIYALNSL